VRGLKGGAETVHNYYLGPQGYHRKWNASATAVTTAMGAVSALKLLIDGHFSRKGVVPPELVDKPDMWITELTKRGIRILESVEMLREM
jgi:saccharopine dehydrogenase-like NADP-dependent oxidoreductase